MLRLLFLGPLLALQLAFAVLQSAFGLVGLVLGTIFFVLFALPLMLIGVLDAFAVNPLLGIVCLFPSLWTFDWVFGLIHLITGENLWRALVNWVHLFAQLN